jgi:transposase
MRPRLQTSIPAEGAPNSASYGRMRAMIGRLAAPIHRASSTSMRPIVRPSGRLAPIASEALERIAWLYAVEKEIRGRSADERRVTRQDRSRPIIDELEPWLRAKLALISQKSKLAEAIRYALSRRPGLTRFLDDGRIEIDSNVVERSIRPIALNRKNALFAGSDGGGEHWAVIASLIETCKLNSVDPYAYLTDVISKIVNGHPNSRIDELLPWAHPAAHPLKDVA